MLEDGAGEGSETPEAAEGVGGLSLGKKRLGGTFPLPTNPWKEVLGEGWALLPGNK